MMNDDLLGTGLYSAADAGRYLGIAAEKVRRWLTGHRVGETKYEPLWRPQIELEDGSQFLGFRDLMELRTAQNFMAAGLSAQRIRRAIELAREVIQDARPLSTTRFRTDGKNVFMQVAEESEDDEMLDLFKGQYVFSKIIERSFRNVDYDGIAPTRWWVNSEKDGILIDPQRAFGQPIDDQSGVPTAILANALKFASSIKQVARDWDVPERAVRRAAQFEASLLHRAA